MHKTEDRLQFSGNLVAVLTAIVMQLTENSQDAFCMFLAHAKISLHQLELWKKWEKQSEADKWVDKCAHEIRGKKSERTQ